MEIEQNCSVITITSEEMRPLIRPGSTLHCRKIDRWAEHLEYGPVYIIMTSNGRQYLRRIRKYHADPNNFFLLMAENPQFDDILIRREEVSEIWSVESFFTRLVQ